MAYGRVNVGSNVKYISNSYADIGMGSRTKKGDNIVRCNGDFAVSTESETVNAIFTLYNAMTSKTISFDTNNRIKDFVVDENGDIYALAYTAPSKIFKLSFENNKLIEKWKVSLSDLNHNTIHIYNDEIIVFGDKRVAKFKKNDGSKIWDKSINHIVENSKFLNRSENLIATWRGSSFAVYNFDGVLEYESKTDLDTDIYDMDMGIDGRLYIVIANRVRNVTVYNKGEFSEKILLPSNLSFTFRNIMCDSRGNIFLKYTESYSSIIKIDYKGNHFFGFSIQEGIDGFYPQKGVFMGKDDKIARTVLYTGVTEAQILLSATYISI